MVQTFHRRPPAALTRRNCLKGMLGLSLTAGTGGLIQGCGGNGTAGQDSPTEKAELQVWQQETAIEASLPSAAAFEAEYPDIKIGWVPTPGDQAATKLMAAISARSGAPDLAFIGYDHMSPIIARDGAGVVDLRPHMTSGEYDLDQWFDWNIDLVTTESGKIIGLPTDLGVMGNFYRRDVFDKAGLPSEPEDVFGLIQTWDDFITTGKAIAATGNFILNSAFTVFDILRQQDVQAYFDSDGTPLVNSPRYVEAAEFAQRIRRERIDLHPANYIYDEDSVPEASAAMQEGRVACYFSAAWYDIIIHATAPDTEGLWGVTTLPEHSTGNRGGSYYMIPEQTDHEDEAWLFASFIQASREGLDLRLKDLKFLPAWSPSYDLPVFTSEDPFYRGQVWLETFVENASNIPPITLNTNDTLARDEVRAALVDILDEDADPQKRLDQAADDIERQMA